MSRARTFASSPFGSALLGGLVVAVFGLVAIAAGWSGDDDDEPQLGTALSTPVSDDADDSAVAQIYKRSADGVVSVRADRGEGEADPLGLPIPDGGGSASGSGFAIDGEGHILTNAHVVDGAESVTVQVGEERENRDAELIGMDPSSDVALLRVDDKDGIQPLELGSSSQVEIGDPVVAIGNPFGLDRTVTTGIVSAKQRQIQAPNGFSITDVLQTDAAVNPGNSGGPLLDASGRVIGINSQIATSGGGNEGVAFAVPIETARDVAEQLLDDGTVERAYLGITGGDLTPEAAEALGLSVERGVLVESVVQNGPADKAGIKGATGQTTLGGEAIPEGGDIIVELDGEKISGMDEVISAVNAAEPGEEMKLTVVRDGEEREVTITLGKRPAQIEDAAVDPRP